MWKTLSTTRFEAVRRRRTMNTIYAECLRRTNYDELRARKLCDRYFRIFGECLEEQE